MKRLIVIEGIDGCGKQTQTKMLYDACISKGYKTFKMSFPNYDYDSSAPVKLYISGEFGDSNSLDAYQASMLFATDRLCTIKKLENTFKENDIVILDRYSTANMLHQAGKIKDINEKKKFLNWIYDLEFNILKLPVPTDVIFLDLDYHTSMKLANARAELKSGTKKDILETDENYLKNSYLTAKTCIDMFNWKVVDCNDNEHGLKSVECIHDMILKTLNLN